MRTPPWLGAGPSWNMNYQDPFIPDVHSFHPSHFRQIKWKINPLSLWNKLMFFGAAGSVSHWIPSPDVFFGAAWLHPSWAVAQALREEPLLEGFLFQCFWEEVWSGHWRRQELCTSTECCFPRED